MTKISTYIMCTLIISIILLNGCVQKEKGVTDYSPPRVLNLEVSKTVSTDKLEIKLISAEKVKSYYAPDLNKMQEAKEGKIYILIEAELKNIHSENIYGGSNEFYLLDNKGTRYIPGLYFGEDELEMFTELEQNEKIKGKLVFVIPESTEDFKIEYDITSLTW